jgi:hypothetical protein
MKLFLISDGIIAVARLIGLAAVALRLADQLTERIEGPLDNGVITRVAGLVVINRAYA